ncbi:MAG: hypothetical protein L6R38_005972 [Xanthoria sp. 2 TBL-2021]|nr:MAG: hypothetical protein L6R38_005972 [Xanthoria sp. 2 TBL-2021]
MGWLSSSKKADEAPNPSLLSNEAPTDSAPGPPPNTSPVSPPPQNDSSDAELQAFLSSLETTPRPNDSPQRSIPDKDSSSPTPSCSSDLITPSTLLPSTISCQSAFDSAFYCQSLGGQFNNVYRYGTLRDCREQWKQFWFCMKTNRGFLGDEEREKRVREHYKLREMKYRVGPSSEDVWKPRTRMVEGAFDRSLEEDERVERERALLEKS